VIAPGAATPPSRPVKAVETRTLTPLSGRGLAPSNQPDNQSGQGQACENEEKQKQSQDGHGCTISGEG
jgi:hypothetical protein